MSKPLSRKTIYFTNIIGGIGMILIFMLLNTAIFGIFSLWLPIVVKKWKIKHTHFE